MIKLKNISIGYDNNIIIDNFSYTFANTGLYAIKGESGCGKTTLLNSIAMFHKLNSGSILYSNDISNVNESISLIFQDNNLFENLTVIENIKLLTSLSKDIDDSNINSILNEINISKYKNTKVSNLSGGERQRVSIAIAIILDKKVILADEPLSSLDDDNSNKIMELFKKISKDRLVILSSHNSFILEKYCDYIINLNNLENYHCEENQEYDLISANNNKKKLKFIKLLNIYFKVIKEKKIMKFFLSIIFVILMMCLAFSFSISSYNKKDVFIKTMDKSNIDCFSIYGINDEEFRSNTNGKKIFSYSPKIYGYEPSSTSLYYNAEFMKYCIIDDKLANNEIIITDYIAYLLKDGGALSFNSINEVKNKIIYFKNNINDENYDYYDDIKIKDVIITEFSDFYKNSSSIPWNRSYDENEIYNYYLINFETLYNYFKYSSIVDVKTYDFTDSPEKRISVYVDENLSGNDVILNNYAYEELLKGQNLSIGSNLNIELKSNNTINLNCVLKDITTKYNQENGFKTYYLFISREMWDKLDRDSVIQRMDVLGYYYNDFDNISTMKDIILYALENNYTIKFPGSGNINMIFLEIDFIKNSVIKVSIIVLIVLSTFFMIYSTMNLYKENQRKFAILEIYGMKRSYELVLLIINSLIVVVISVLFGSVLNYYLNKLFNLYIEKSYDLIMYIPTYKFVFNVYAGLILVGLLYSMMVIGYLISLRRRIKTHIS